MCLCVDVCACAAAVFNSMCMKFIFNGHTWQNDKVIESIFVLSFISSQNWDKEAICCVYVLLSFSVILTVFLVVGSFEIPKYRLITCSFSSDPCSFRRAFYSSALFIFPLSSELFVSVLFVLCAFALHVTFLLSNLSLLNASLRRCHHKLSNMDKISKMYPRKKDADYTQAANDNEMNEKRYRKVQCSAEHEDKTKKREKKMYVPWVIKREKWFFSRCWYRKERPWKVREKNSV